MKRTIISLILNIIIVLLVSFGVYMMFTGLVFTENNLVLEARSMEMFKFFTVDSNILMGIVSLIFVIYEILLLKGKIDKIPKSIYIFKLMGTCGVALTFLVVFLYLAWIAEGGVLVMIQNSNLFFHLIVPVLSIISFYFFERSDALKFRDTFYGLVPMSIYAIFYVVNILIHMNNGKVSYKYDWYFFVQNGVWTIIIVLLIIIGLTYLSSFILWKGNSKYE